jgi:NADPH:quinone reductase-like Zn-dependent oxidoreductase
MLVLVIATPKPRMMTLKAGSHVDATADVEIIVFSVDDGIDARTGWFMADSSCISILCKQAPIGSPSLWLALWRRKLQVRAHKPRIVSFAQAAAMVTTGLTAYQCLDHARLRPGEPLFVAGGSGGVGSILIQFARHAAAGPILSTTSGEASARYLTETLSLPRERLLFYAGLSRRQLAERLREMNGGRLFRVAIDCVGGAMTGLCCDSVDFDGDVISIVNGPRDDSHPVEEDDENRLFNRSAAFHFVMTSALATYGPPEAWPVYRRQLTDLSQLIGSGALELLQIIEAGELSVATVRRAHEMLERGRLH